MITTGFRVGGTVAALYVAYVTLCMGGGGSFEGAGRPVDALMLYSTGRAAGRAAEQALSNRKIDDAVFYARMALTRSAYNQAALRVLGSVAQIDVQPEVAEQLYTLSAGLGWRDTGTTTWLFRHALSHGDTAMAAREGNALARRKRGLSTVMVQFRQMLAQPGGIDALTQQLAGHPPWRTMFFRELINSTPAEQNGLRVLAMRLRAAGMPTTTLECAPLGAAALDVCGLQDA
ncbi:hypothetical protein [Sphingomonas sp. R86520]|uniref:hypothetical protein n=1 Tax=Sphingomonas sp. R86520 TaxID=3093859 RepID=UPI0036D3E43A